MPFWLDRENPPKVARATVYRDGVPTTVYHSWDESLPIETAQTDDGRLWRDLWEKNPMQRFGSYVVRAALRRAFREVIGDRVEPDEDAPKVPAKDELRVVASTDWDSLLREALTVVEIDTVWRNMRGARARTGEREVAYNARRSELAAAEWEPAEDDPGATTAMTNDEYQTSGTSMSGVIGSFEPAALHEMLAAVEPTHQGRAPQDHLPSNRAARRAAARKKGSKR
jgi:hypothetical protein